MHAVRRAIAFSAVAAKKCCLAAALQRILQCVRKAMASCEMRVRISSVPIMQKMPCVWSTSPE